MLIPLQVIPHKSPSQLITNSSSSSTSHKRGLTIIQTLLKLEEFEELLFLQEKEKDVLL